LDTKLQSNFHKHQANYPKSTSKNEVKIEEKSLKDVVHLFGCGQASFLGREIILYIWIPIF
jgi:hypothetical protein